MMKVICAAACTVVVGLAVPASAATESECQSNWSKMDAKGNGFVAGSGAKRYIAMMKKAKMTMAESNRISRSEYMSACVSDVFKRGGF